MTVSFWSASTALSALLQPLADGVCLLVCLLLPHSVCNARGAFIWKVHSTNALRLGQHFAPRHGPLPVMCLARRPYVRRRYVRRSYVPAAMGSDDERVGGQRGSCRHVGVTPKAEAEGWVPGRVGRSG